MGRGHVIGAIGLLLVACSSYSADETAVDGGSSGGSTSGTSQDGGSSSGATTTDSGGSSGVVLKAGEIACGETSIVCNVHDTYCCLNVSGTDGEAGRSYNTTQAKCEALEAGTCGSYIGAGDDFSIKLPQTCTKASDCSSDTVCCAVSAEPGKRFSTFIGRIQCMAAADCNTKGRLLCTEKSECPSTENCLPETDPVLSHVYKAFCH